MRTAQPLARPGAFPAVPFFPSPQGFGAKSIDAEVQDMYLSPSFKFE